MKDKIVEQVVNKYTQRSETGVAKYGTTLEQNNTDNFYVHLQEELMDATLYLQKLIQQRSELIKLVTEIEDDQELGMKIRYLIRWNFSVLLEFREGWINFALPFFHTFKITKYLWI